MTIALIEILLIGVAFILFCGILDKLENNKVDKELFLKESLKVQYKTNLYLDACDISHGKYCLMIDGIIDDAICVFNNEDSNYEHMIWKRSDDLSVLKYLRSRYMSSIRIYWKDCYTEEDTNE